jgi:protein SCO1/2
MKLPPSLLLCTGLALAALAGCSRSEKKSVETAAVAPKEHALTGEVVAVTPARSAVLVHHEEIPGYMPPMTMEFLVAPADLARLKEGQRLRARMTQDTKGDLHLEAIELIDPVKERAIAAAANQLRQDTSAQGKEAYREVGETVPQFTLYNQDGEVVSINRFRGRRVVMNFIYTRCPIATMCPASTAHMMDLQRVAKEKGITNLELVSITLDPAYDTPSVLKDYARVRGIDTANFTFLTGPEAAVRDLLHQFGVIVEPGENYLKHTLSTLLIDEQGRIIHRVDGTQWAPAEFLKRL